MNDWCSPGGKGNAFFSEQVSNIPRSTHVLFDGEYERNDTTYFPSVFKNNYIVRVKIVVSDVVIHCYKLEGIVVKLVWTATTACYTGVRIIGDCVVSGDGVYRLENGECLISIPSEKVDFWTRSVLYEEKLFVRTDSGNSLCFCLSTGEKLDSCHAGLSVFDSSNGMAFEVNAAEKVVEASSLSDRNVKWKRSLEPYLADSGWNLVEKVVPLSVINSKVYLVVGVWLIVLDSGTGQVVSEFEYFKRGVEPLILGAFPGVSIGSQYYASQIATDGNQICLINYGHPSWMMLLDSEMKTQWANITSEQYVGVIVGDILFTSSENFHRGYDMKSGEEIWKSSKKSNCTNLLVGEKFICFEDANGRAELFGWC